MNKKDITELLEKDYNYYPCYFCNSDFENPTMEGMENIILNCNNCYLDIIFEGKYTSYGIGYISALYKKSDQNDRDKIIWLLKKLIEEGK